MHSEDGLILMGLEGGNPLAFLAAMGTLRSLTQRWPDRRVRMSWLRLGSWRPVVHVEPATVQAEVVLALDEYLKRMRDHHAWSIGKDLSVRPQVFQKYAANAARQARGSGDRTWADFAAAFGCEATVTENGLIQDTALRTMSGAGHQHFVEFMQIIVERTGPQHLEKALFHTWRYDDPLEKQTLRWDPIDDVRRALRWRDPSGDPERRKRGGMLGANRLAIEGLPLFPTVPQQNVLRTTGFTGRGNSQNLWTWPIWSCPLTLDVVRSVLALSKLGNPGESPGLESIGIVEILCSHRLTIDKFRSFSPGQPVELTPVSRLKGGSSANQTLPRK